MQKVNSSKMFEGIDQYTNYPYEYLRCNKSSQVTINRHVLSLVNVNNFTTIHK